MAGHVYLIGSSKFRWYKIGKSSNASIRIVDLGLLLPFRIEVVSIVRSDGYWQLERWLHEKHADCRINGEWFSFSHERLKQVINDMALLGKRVDGMIDFENAKSDVGPNGKFIVVKFKRKEPVTLSPEECEERKQRAIAKKKAEGWVPLTAEERLARKNKSIADRAERKKLRGPRYFFLDNRLTG